MPWEFGALQHEPEPLDKCPMCGAEFKSFLRGLIHSSWRRFARVDYVCVICESCKEVVGYEQPHTFTQRRFRGDDLQGL